MFGKNDYNSSTTIATSSPSSAGDVIDLYSEYHLNQSDDEPKNGAVKVTFYGTSMLLFDDGETQLLVDPFISHPSRDAFLEGRPIQTNTTEVDEVLSRPEFRQPLALFTAHSHFDHVIDAAYIAQKTGAHLYGSNSTLNVGRGWGLPEEQMTLYQPGEELMFGNFTVTVLPSKHSVPLPGLNDDIGQVIDQPLKQPAPYQDFKEGGTFDLLIKHDGHSILVKPSDNWLEGGVRQRASRCPFLRYIRDTLYNQTVGKVHPQLVIPVHWDNFTMPLSNHLVAWPNLITAAFDFLIKRLSADISNSESCRDTRA